MEIHNIEPVFDAASRVLILGSFPSVSSREASFFYAHPQNRFWKVLAAVLHAPVPADIPAKKRMLLAHHIALWDVIASCDIRGSSDASITNVQPNELTRILERADIQAVFCNGAAAYNLYNRLEEPILRLPAQKLPSTSPANAAWSLDRLTAAWRAALGPYLPL